MSARTIMIVTGEASGDLHGAGLARALLQQDPGLVLLGMGGDRMREAGVELLYHNRQLGVMGLVEVFQKWGAILRAYRILVHSMRMRDIDMVVLIDSPDFNLRLARVACRMKIPTVYYIGPKIWAWRSGRIETISKWISQMLVIFPFEEELYRAQGISCRFVGNPIMDEMIHLPSRAELRHRFGISSSIPLIALLPGSRQMEIDRLLDVMLDAFKLIRRDYPLAEAIIPVPSSISITALKHRISRRAEQSEKIRVIPGEAAMALTCADTAIVASGTATLEAAIVGTPMVIVYKVAWLTALVFRLMVKVPYVGLANIVAGRQIVPELLQSNATAASLAQEVKRFLESPGRMEEVKKDLEEVRRKLGSPGAAQRAASSILKTLLESTRSVAA